MPVPIVTIDQMRQWEQATWAAGQTETAVIGEVGRLVARRAQTLTRRGGRILILAGKGHNGDDARCAAPHLTSRIVELVEVADPDSALAPMASALGRRPDLVIDGLFGIGLNRPLDTGWIRLIDRLNDAGPTVLAVDVPSGLNAQTGESMGAVVRATVTLTLAAPKPGLLATAATPCVGRLEVEPDIGLVPCPVSGNLLWVLPHDFSGLPSARPVTAHKGSLGHAILVAGWPGYHGAAVLAARGAQRARPGLITLFATPEIYQPVAAQLQAVMVRPTPAALDLPEGWTALLIGPGLAGPGAAARFQRESISLWRSARQPLVVDASALGWLGEELRPAPGPRVLTPHPGEAARMLRSKPDLIQADRPGALRRLSTAHGDCWVVLKGHQTLIGRSTGPLYINSSGNPDLAQGGSGDILAGYLTGLLAQPDWAADPARTLTFGVWQHGATADLLSTPAMPWTPEDLAATIGTARPHARAACPGGEDA